MKSRLVVVTLIVAVLAWCVPSCSLPLFRYGNGASVTLALNGLVVPTDRTSADTDGSRLILPMTARIKVEVTGPDNFQKSADVAMNTANLTLTISDLLVGKELAFVISALDTAGNALTKATVTAVLQAGQNSLTATLKPDPAIVVTRMVSNISSNASVMVDSTLTLAPGEFKLLKVDYMADTDTERQLQFDGQVFRWPWVRVFDENWTPLPVIAVDEALGWVVVKLPAGSHSVMVAVANIAPAGILPPGQITGQLMLRQCVFIDKNGTGSGTSQSPALLDPALISTYADKAVFLRAGTYVMNDGIILNTYSSYYLYGGFGQDWKSKIGPTELQLSQTSSMPAVLSVGGVSPTKLFMDNVNIAVQGYGSMFQRNGISVQTGATVRIFRSSIAGCVTQTPINAGSPLASAGLSIDSGIVEIGLSTIRGGFAGNLYSSMSASATGIVVSGTNTYMLTIQSSVIDGGTAVTDSGAATACGINLGSSASNGIMVLNRSRLFGGVSQSTVGTVSSFGINATASTSQKLLVFNSMLTGGQALGDTTGASTYSIYTKDNAALCISGNVIDSGRALGTSGLLRVSCMTIEGIQTVDTIVNCNIFISTGDKIVSYDGASTVLSESNLDFNAGKLSEVTGNSVVTNADLGYFNIPSYFWVTNDNSGAYTFSRYTLTMGQKYSDIFAKFALPSATMLFTRFDEWVNGNYWKVQPAFSIFMANSAANAVPTFVTTMLDSNTFASLFYDLGGSPRPSSGIWKIGAFE